MLSEEHRTLLGHLARAYGMGDAYFDIWGAQHVVSAETQQACLRAMGVVVDTVDDLRRSLAWLHEDYWTTLCDPVLVVQHGRHRQPLRLRLRSEPFHDAAWTIRWSLQSEPGTPVDGSEVGSLQRTGTIGPSCSILETTYVDGVRYIAIGLTPPDDLPDGYYRWTIEVRDRYGHATRTGVCTLIVAPETCYVPRAVTGERRAWGIWLQLYALRSTRNWGIGDFTDLHAVTEWVARELGGGAVGVNPLHALQNQRPYHISPYAPDSRSALNEIYLDVEAVADYASCEAAQQCVRSEAFQSRRAAARARDVVDYDEVGSMKRAVMELLYRQFLSDASDDRRRVFRDYCDAQRAWLDDYATYRALKEVCSPDPAAPIIWRDWPIEYRHPRSPQVEAFRVQHRERIGFFQYVQWQAEEQLAAVVRTTEATGMGVGLYHDLALGSDAYGAEGWVLQDVLVREVDCGCPPDAFSLDGQNWGFPPFHPVALRRAAYGPLIALFRQAMRRGGALRLDHVMWLFRLFWIPKGKKADAGVYVQYPQDEMLAVLALESQRARTLVIGEDLGTVPKWVREVLGRLRAFSYRVWYFERHADGRWKGPQDYPQDSLAVATTHDLPTLLGFWTGDDLAMRVRLGLFSDEAVQKQQQAARDADRRRMSDGLREHGGWTAASTPVAASGQPPDGLVEAVHRFLARTESRLVLASLDDWTGEQAQANVPGTVDEYPNWMRKQQLSVEALVNDDACRRLAAVMVDERGRGSAASPAQSESSRQAHTPAPSPSHTISERPPLL
ncbi:MAG: 4-alpha-glucanotransferase [Nitrospiraceae bacterium]